MEWTTPIWQFLGTVVGAIIGAYIAGRYTERGRIDAVKNALAAVVQQETVKAFAQEQGKQDAMLANLDKLQTQVRMLTTTQEEIRSKVSLDLWRNQRRWDERRNSYSRLLELLDTMYSGLIKEDNKDAQQAIRDACFPLAEKFRQAMAEASIFLDEDEIESLDALRKAFGEAGITGDLKAAKDVILAAKRDLVASAKKYFGGQGLARDLSTGTECG